jgi:hypothetical protein
MLLLKVCAEEFIMIGLLVAIAVCLFGCVCSWAVFLGRDGCFLNILKEGFYIVPGRKVF